MRLVLDTNVLLGALLTRGTPPDLLYQAWRRGDFVLISSAAQIEEVARVLDYPHLRDRITRTEAVLLVDGLKTLATLAEYLPDVAMSRDADDDKILATALAGQADYLVSGDKDLLSLPETCGVKVVTPRDAMDIISGQNKVIIPPICFVFAGFPKHSQWPVSGLQERVFASACPGPGRRASRP